MSLISVANDEVLGHSAGLGQNKQTLKSGSALLGHLLADSLKSWGDGIVSQLPLQLLSKVKEKPIVLAMFNSSAYRRDSVIPQGPITRQLILGMNPFPGKAKMYKLSGRDVQTIFSAIRSYRVEQHNGAYSPQISSNLREKNGFQLQVNLSSGWNKAKWRNIRPRIYYYLVLDDWLAKNGYRIPELDRVLNSKSAKARVVAEEAMREILLRFFPQHLQKAARPSHRHSVHGTPGGCLGLESLSTGT